MIWFDLIYYSFLSLWNSWRSSEGQKHQNRIKQKICVEILSSKLSQNLKISIIIPSFNEEHQIHSVLEHALQDENIEIIVSDGGSKDSTIEILKGFCSKYENIKYLTGRSSQFIHSPKELQVGNLVHNAKIWAHILQVVICFYSFTLTPFSPLVLVIQLEHSSDKVPPLISSSPLIYLSLDSSQCVIGAFTFDIDDHSVRGIDLIVELVRLRCLHFSLP
jgi:glycosyltransferase involved in cell wall biosynthesis